MARIAKKTKCYPSDLTDEEWDQISPLMPKPGHGDISATSSPP